MQCGAPAARRRRLEKIPGRNRMGLVALNDLVPGGRAPSPQPIRPIGPGLPQKAGAPFLWPPLRRRSELPLGRRERTETGSPCHDDWCRGRSN